MHKIRNIGISALLFATIITLSGCGGGSDGGGPSPTTPAPPPPTPVPDDTPATPSLEANGLSLYGDLTANVGESVGFAITTDDNTSIRSVEWEQVNGPTTIDLLASHTQAIGFDLATAGEYAFTVQAITSSGQTRNLDFTLQVGNNAGTMANIRLDHAATERGRVSLRVDGVDGKTITAVTWDQVAGPAAQNVVIDADNLNYVFFDAPAVTTDRVIVYSATVTYDDQTTGTDTALVAITNDTINESGFFPSNNLITTADMFAYRADSPYAAALDSCVYNNQIANSCAFSTLPLIGQVNENPSIEDILDRTYVSHRWMGERFEQFLRTSAAGPDMVQLLRATTAVVISYEVRPSFYWTATGAIYLDGNNFWLTPQERDTLNDRPDFRSDFGQDLAFVIPWRYVKDRDYYPAGRYPQAQRSNRTFSDLEASISWLMYHELGHANDFFPPSRWANLSMNDNPLAHFRNNGATSDNIPVSYPLGSAEMKSLAQVRFAGEAATTTQRNYNGADIEQFFAPDVSPSFYSYLNEREDFATLFERFMMLYRLGASNDVGIINTVNNDELIVTWGQRNRISDNSLQLRVRFAVENVLPDLDVAAIQAQLPAPQLLDPSKSWFDNVILAEGLQSLSDNSRVRLYDPRVHVREHVHAPHHGFIVPNN
ncbi:PKD domain-containing protein [Alteromonas flava]|uniref:PKD domain-containing protein n=1 Tax=Alteromonas flava TaxID=2048003 RepID=UPI000C29370F|nr:hypothetical protein [Alteromonas flava]